MSKSENAIVLKAGGRGMECIGTVRLTPEAEKVVRRLKAKTGLPSVKSCRTSSSRLRTSSPLKRRMLFDQELQAA